MPERTCSAENCEGPLRARDRCHKHYMQWWKANRSTAKRPSMEQRFWAKVDRRKPDDCWPWLAAKFYTGYGEFGIGGRSGTMTVAHRVAYELTFGPIPKDLVIDHLCRNKACCNPAHLEAVTQSQNVLRGERWTSS